VSLATAFAAYLRQPPRGAADAFAANLESAGLSAAASLLRTYAAKGDTDADAGELLPGRSDRRCAIGSRPPADCAPGDVWFDVGEVIPMLLVPRPLDELAELSAHHLQRLTPYVSWLSIAPAAVWQVRGWALATGGGQLASDQPEHAPATGLRALEARAYAGYFGKSMADTEDWNAVARAFPRPVVERLWPDDESELGGYVEEGVVCVLRRDVALHDPDGSDLVDLDDECELEDETTPLPGVRLRTHVSTQLGLFDSSPSTGRWPRTP
jgi:hypothetical protein